MMQNPFPYLLKQSILKSLEGTVIGGLVFSALTLFAFLGVRDFPIIEITADTLVYGLFALVLFAGFIIAAGICFALWFYWETMRSGFSTKRILPYAILLGEVTWIGFAILIVDPIAWAVWENYFTAHSTLAIFFDISSMLIGCGAGAWAGLRLKRELTQEPELFTTRWKKLERKMHFRMFLQGGGWAVLSALAANLMFAIFFAIFMQYDAGINDAVSMIGFIATLGSMFSCVPAALGGYALAYLIYQDIGNSTATKNNSFTYGSVLGGLAAFAVCIIFGGLYLTNPHSTSVATVTPAIMLVTFLAFWAGGWSGMQLFKQIQRWQV
jgi:hypothetical protein